MKNENNHPSKIRPIIQIAARMIKDDPSILDDIDNPDRTLQLGRLRAALKIAIPELANKKECPCCGASMAEYADVLDINDALLVLNMAQIVRQRTNSGVPFTEANKVRVSSEGISHTQKCRTTKCSKLGLIAKAGNASWSITTRGWDALRGAEVPRVRVTFRGRILERPEETTTFGRVFREHRETMAEKQSRGKVPKSDHRTEFETYDQNDWVHIIGYNPGNLL